MTEHVVAVVGGGIVGLAVARELTRRRHHLGAIIANRVLPATLTRRGAATSAKRLAEAARDEATVARVADAIGVGDDERPVVAAVLGEVAARFPDVALVAAREAERRAELAELAPQVLDAPMLDSDVNDLTGLLELVGHLRT